MAKHRTPRASTGETRLLLVIVATALLVAAAPPSALALSTSDNTPFPASPLLAGASWTGASHGPPANQFGDILSTTWADNGDLYVLMDDGGTDAPGNGALWRNSFAQITGSPETGLQFTRVGGGPPAATRAQIASNPSLWSGPLGSYYATGFTSVDHVFYATQMNNWNWNANDPFEGLAGIAYSTDGGQQWHFPAMPFPAPIGNLNWVQQGRDAADRDGYVYAISTEREFNASNLIIGRSRPDATDVTNPARWEWASGSVSSGRRRRPVWSSSISRAQPIVSWSDHITYPRMSYDPPLHLYLLTFTYSYASAPPGIWKNGSELVVLESTHPWGPFSFVASGPYFGPSNGYDPAFPVKWISANGLDLWMIWAANFDGCATGLNCSGAYGFNYQQLQLTLTSRGARRTLARSRALRLLQTPTLASTRRGTAPPFQLPRLYLSGTALKRLVVRAESTALLWIIIGVAPALVLMGLALRRRRGSRRR